jgi:hypothetical protein
MREYTERLAALASHWNAVEGRIKSYEHFAGGANAAAINELRYAGRRIVDVLALIAANADSEKINEECVIAESYIVNADHDVTDGIAFIVMQQVNRVIEKHGKDTIAEHYSDFWEVYPMVLKAQKIVQGSREDRPNRKADYIVLSNEYLPKLMDLHDKIAGIKALHVPTEDDELRRVQMRIAVVTVIATVGGIFSTLGFFLTWWAWAYPLNYWEIFWRIF